MDKKQRKANERLQQATSFAKFSPVTENIVTKIISPQLGKRLKFAILKENIYLDSYWTIPTRRKSDSFLSGNIVPFMRKGTLVSYEHTIHDECAFTDSNHNIIIGKCWQAKTVIFGKPLKYKNHD